MKYRVVFARQARENLGEIFAYLAPEMGARPARKYVAKIRDYCMNFSTFPKRGMLREDIRPNTRLVGYRKKATIAFMIKGDTVTILRIFHHGRNIDFDAEAPDTNP